MINVNVIFLKCILSAPFVKAMSEILFISIYLQVLHVNMVSFSKLNRLLKQHLWKSDKRSKAKSIYILMNVEKSLLNSIESRKKLLEKTVLISEIKHCRIKFWMLYIILNFVTYYHCHYCSHYS